MKKLVLFVLVALLVGCGSADYAAPNIDPKIDPNIDRAYRISLGLIQPTEQDFKNLDVSPTINGVCRPDGVINGADIVKLMEANPH